MKNVELMVALEAALGEVEVLPPDAEVTDEVLLEMLTELIMELNLEV